LSEESIVSVVTGQRAERQAAPDVLRLAYGLESIRPPPSVQMGRPEESAVWVKCRATFRQNLIRIRQFRQRFLAYVKYFANLASTEFYLSGMCVAPRVNVTERSGRDAHAICDTKLITSDLGELK
jgi:hypothetical protein